MHTVALFLAELTAAWLALEIAVCAGLTAAQVLRRLGR
jgi:hypothetical protein